MNKIKKMMLPNQWKLKEITATHQISSNYCEIFVENVRQKKYNCVVSMSDTKLHVCVTWKPTMVRNFLSNDNAIYSIVEFNATQRKIQLMCLKWNRHSFCPLPGRGHRFHGENV